MRLMWNLLEYFNIYIHLDVNSDVNSQPFFMWFCRHHRLELRQLPSKFGGVWSSTSKLLMQSTEPTMWQRRRSVFRWYLSQFSTVLHVILHTLFTAVAATALKIWWGLIEYSKSLLMWCTETTLFPRRQSAENAGRHWNSTEEVLSPIVHVWLSS